MVHIIRIVATLIASACFGAAVWWLSPRIVGEVEAWDGPFWYYPVSLYTAGFLGGAVWPLRPGLVTVGVALGQIIYVTTQLPGGPLWIIGMFLGVFCLLFVIAGSGTSWLVWWVLSASRQSSAVND